MIAGFVFLGMWQLSRAAEKNALLAASRTALAMPDATLAEALRTDPVQYRVVRVRGHYLPQRQFLLDNSIRNGRVGYEVLTFLAAAGAGPVLVNRGWVPASPDRRILPDIVTPSGDLTLEASIRLPGGKSLPVFGPWMENGYSWPRRIQSLDIGRMEEQAGMRSAFSGWLHLAPDQPGSLAYRPVIPRLDSERHEAYALQWFTFAAVALVLFVVRGFPQRRTVNP